MVNLDNQESMVFNMGHHNKKVRMVKKDKMRNQSKLYLVYKKTLIKNILLRDMQEHKLKNINS